MDFGLPDFDLPTDTATLFHQLHTDLTSDKYKNTIKNVVVDLTTNDGGSADSLVYALSTLVGKVTIDVTNLKTNALNHQSFMADINADGKFDDKDKSISELGFKIFILSSNATFSSGNALAVYAKLNNPKVVTLGEKTGGGPCAVRQFITPIGSMVSSSSTMVLSKALDNKYVSIESGVAADHELTYEQMVDRQYIVNNLKNW
jgi:C-terminal processing protease CtpA/Prc